MEHGKDGGVRADAEGKGQNCYDCEAGALPQHAHGVAVLTLALGSLGRRASSTAISRQPAMSKKSGRFSSFTKMRVSGMALVAGREMVA